MKYKKIIFLIIIFILIGTIGCLQSAAQGAISASEQQELEKYLETASPESLETSLNALSQISFPELKDNSALSGDVTVKVKVPYAESMDVYLTSEESNLTKFIGMAQKAEEDNWIISLSSASFTNGNYTLTVKMKNSLGMEENAEIKVQINNPNNSESLVKIDEATVAKWQEDINSASAEKIQADVDKVLDSLLPSEWLEKYFYMRVCSRKDICGAQADPDKDELTNFEELRFRTDPQNPDSDRDGFKDGDEIKSGFDPMKYSPGDKSDKIIFENPKESGELKADLYKIFEVLSSKTGEGKTGITIKGKALPNGFINIYVYSSLPVILTVKADANGNWSYILDEEIEDGEHQIYIAVTDNTGKITAKSEPLFFIKTAEAVSIVPPTQASDVAQIASPVEKRKTSYFLISLIVVAVTLILSLIFIGIRMSVFNKETSMADGIQNNADDKLD